MNTSKDPVRLRKRTLRSGNVSLYLDIYINGHRSYEFLGLYLLPGRSAEVREKNRETLRVAEAVRSKRVVEIHDGRFGFQNQGKLNTNFIDYFRTLTESRRDTSHGNHQIWLCTLSHLETYASPSTTFRDLTPAFIEGFKTYLEKKATNGKYNTAHPLLNSTRWAYFNKFRAAINQACREGLLSENPLLTVQNFKMEDVEKVYLTLDEVRALAATPCRYEGLRKSFLFSCLTGLRKSDIEKLRWGDVRREGKFTRIVFKQRKTKGQEYMDISPEAERYMGEQRGPDSLVFPDFTYGTHILAGLRDWARRAGITKRITFHTARHTFAVLMLELGADIYTVQKLLGHRSLATTQIYAEVVDKKKRDAAMLIPAIEAVERSEV